MYLLTLLLLTAGLAGAQSAFSGVDRIVAIGDVHGDYNAFLTVLRDAGIIDSKDRWSGGKTHLVQTGDILDRGPDSRRVMELLQSLEKQAVKAGGRVHSLLGNHEVMNMMGDLRYVVPGEFAAFRTADSERLRDSYWDRQTRHRTPKPGPEERQKWDAEHPLGWVEHRTQFGSDGDYGQWMRAKNAVVKVNDTLFLHGGLSAKFAAVSLDDLNRTIRKELSAIPRIKTDSAIITDNNGPLWYRGLALEDGPETARLVDSLLQFHGVKRIVIGHTTTPGAILQRFDGRVVTIDVGLSAYYGDNRACLLMEGQKLFAIHRGQKIELPGPGPEAFQTYLKQIAALEPANSNLAKFAAKLGVR
jgi:hypothetical protein